MAVEDFDYTHFQTMTVKRNTAPVPTHLHFIEKYMRTDIFLDLRKNNCISQKKKKKNAGFEQHESE